MSLRDVIRRSRELESSAVTRWKLRSAVLRARRELAEWHTWDKPRGEMAQHAHEMVGEDLYDRLVQAEYEFLGGGSCEDVTWQQAEARASNFALKSLVMVERLYREPEHPCLSTERDPEG